MGQKNNRHDSFSENKHLWGVWANLFLCPVIGFDFDKLVSGVSHKLDNLGSNSVKHRSLFMRMGLWHPYSRLLLKFENPIMKPSDIFFIQDSIQPRFQDHKIVSQTKDNLRCRTLSSHQIRPIRVFGWNGGGRWCIHTEDNRRLYAYQRAGLQSVPVEFTTREAVNPTKFSTINGGAQVRVRWWCL